MKEQELTNEEIAKVFAMYLGCEFLYEDHEPETVRGVYGSIVYDNNLDDSGEGIYSVDECKLLLTPLSKITDEHAIEVARINTAYSNFNKLLKNGILKVVSNVERIRVFVDDEYKESQWFNDLSFKTVQYLISKGYAVPLWFGIDHPCNGLTALELEIAIETPTP